MQCFRSWRTPCAGSHPVWVTLRDAGLILALCAGVALIVNTTVHPHGIPLIAQSEYETIVPCPLPGGEVTPITVEEVFAPANARFFFVDARERHDHDAWHVRDAVNIPYDYLDPTPREVLRKLARQIAASRAQRVIVYGDGENPDSGEHLGRELAGHGINHVSYVVGGGPALYRAQAEGAR